MRKLALMLSALVLLALPAAAAADSRTIVVGRSIGPVELGMARGEVVAVLGRPRSTSAFEFASGETGRLARYRKHGGTFTVTYVDDRVVSVATAARFYRTSGGVGPGVPLERAAALEGFRFDQCTGGYSRFAERTYTGFHSTGPQGRIRWAVVALSAYADC